MDFRICETYLNQGGKNDLLVEEKGKWAGLPWAIFASVTGPGAEEATTLLGREMIISLAKVGWGYHQAEKALEVIRALKLGEWTPLAVTTMLYSVGGRAGGGVFADYFDLPTVEVRGKTVFVDPDTAEHVGRWIGSGGSRIKAMNAVAQVGGWKIVIRSPKG